MRHILFAISLLTYYHAVSQPPAAKEYQVFLSSGSSFSGTGDIRGFYITTGIQKNIKKWNYAIELSTNVFDNEQPLFFKTNTGATVNSSIRSTLAGIQLAGIVSNSFIKDEKENLSFGLGIVGRYQTTSIYDHYTILYPAFTGLSYPVIVIDNWDPMRTIAIGGIAKLAYQFYFSKNWAAGACVSFQGDSNGDMFFNKGLTLAYKL